MFHVEQNEEIISGFDHYPVENPLRPHRYRVPSILPSKRLGYILSKKRTDNNKRRAEAKDSEVFVPRGTVISPSPTLL